MNALKTDLYQLTMMAAQYCKGLHKKKVSCEAFVRTLPLNRKFMVMAGTEKIIDFLLNLKFTQDDIKYIREIPELKNIMMTTNFESYLEDFKFTGDLWALSEGEIVYPQEPFVRITGTLPEVHMAETFILSVLNHDVKIASKAARIVLAARGKPVLEFGTRRTHHEAAVDAARAAYLAGFSGTSNVEAGKRFGIPVRGTMSHMWVMIHESEQEAFYNFKDVYNSPTLLIDTYDTIEGAKLALKIPLLSGVRLDSGDLFSLSTEVRKLLNQSNPKAKIIVSNDLNEYKIDKLAKAPIDVFAVGTELVVSSDMPSLGAVFKVVYDDSTKRPLIKLSEGKMTLPGKKQIFIKDDYTHILALENSNLKLDKLLDCYIKKGKRIIPSIELDVYRNYCNANLACLNNECSSLEEEVINYPCVIHDDIWNMFSALKKKEKK